LPDFIEKLRRLADALEKGKRFHSDRGPAAVGELKPLNTTRKRRRQAAATAFSLRPRHYGVQLAFSRRRLKCSL
jgi:hypothetical protein